MTCNNEIHNDLIQMEESTCPFCDKLLIKGDTTDEQCCGLKVMRNINGANTCINCGVIYYYFSVPEYFNFFDNINKIRRKTVYNRLYYVEIVLNNMSVDNSVQLNYSQKYRIYKVFPFLDTIHHKLNVKRKRMISIKFIITKLLQLLGHPHEDIKVTKTKRTLKYYEEYWNQIMAMKGDQIKQILSG